MSDFVTKTFMSIEKKGINASVVWKTTHTHTEKGYNNSIRLGVNEAKTNLMSAGDIRRLFNIFITQGVCITTNYIQWRHFLLNKLTTQFIIQISGNEFNLDG